MRLSALGCWLLSFSTSALIITAVYMQALRAHSGCEIVGGLGFFSGSCCGRHLEKNTQPQRAGHSPVIVHLPGVWTLCAAGYNIDMGHFHTNQPPEVQSDKRRHRCRRCRVRRMRKFLSVTTYRYGLASFYCKIGGCS